MSAPYRITGQAWLESEGARRVIAALEAAGGEDCARFVGGCVRNALLGAAIDDVDIATRLEPQQVLDALKAAGIRAIPTGIEHGTITAVTKGQPFEITTLRRDVETDGRRAVVAFTTDWREDAARRDFRLNALYANGRGEVFDPTGHGVEDALAGRIIFVGDPEQRIREDYLRILRFYRFGAWYGRGAPDAAGHAACARLAQGVTTLSAERISKELLKLLAAVDPVASVKAMEEAGVLSRLLPDSRTETLAAMVTLTNDPLMRLAALLPCDGKVLDRLAGSLRLSNAQRDRLVASAVELDVGMSDVEARGMIWRDGREAFVDRTLRAEASDTANPRWAALRAMAQGWAVPKLPVGGKDIAKAGIKPGPMTGRILKAFEESWIADDFPASGHEERLAAAIARIGRGGNG
ncbi:CCA tRNA nucleotidyltransferase [uncultured Brevundimonas sp.]|uniref:CCA tRNA nucleotidyltransferase n=1 Tax=uncultured Brevundimonas sp. TaxID=213418 RepID=UPI002619D1FA|nr:CCA tRNA nucleotidyltransferase [uncultured Brevundimonas sp.]